MKVNWCTNMRVSHAKSSKQWGPLFWSQKVTWHECCWKSAYPFFFHKTQLVHTLVKVSLLESPQMPEENPQVGNKRENGWLSKTRLIMAAQCKKGQQLLSTQIKTRVTTTARWKQAVKVDTLPHSQPLQRVSLLITTMVFHRAPEW